jgi:hypothetical protein
MNTRATKSLFVFYASLIFITLISLQVSIALAEAFATIEGTVTEDGSPINGANVYIGENDPVVTDSAGIYSGQAEPSMVRVFARTGAGEFIGDETITVSDGETAIVNFGFTPGLLSGIVTENGNAIAGANVSAGFNEPFLTEATGQYSVKVQPGETNVSARTDAGEFIGIQKVTMTASGATTANFDFAPGVVTGFVTENGSQVEGAKVSVGLNEPVITDSSGQYSIKAAPGFVRVFAYSGSDEFIGEQMVTLATGNSVTVNFNFTPVTISGTISSAGSAAPGAMVVLGSNMPLTTDDAGKYTGRIQPGTWRIFAKTSSCEQIAEKIIQVTLETPVTVDLNIR